MPAYSATVIRASAGAMNVPVRPASRRRQYSSSAFRLVGNLRRTVLPSTLIVISHELPRPWVILLTAMCFPRSWMDGERFVFPAGESELGDIAVTSSRSVLLRPF